jgi:hypothetical protein
MGMAEDEQKVSGNLKGKEKKVRVIASCQIPREKKIPGKNFLHYRCIEGVA